ncbi:MAG: adenylate/guanylate cyclase domain-containing protein [Lewinella sp.]|nr:adenylate/guanylate cyclase domain-containing protein [Lewinella sp.]
MSAWSDFVERIFEFQDLPERERRERKLVVELSLWVMGMGLLYNLTYLLLGYPKLTYVSLLSLAATATNLLIYYFSKHFNFFKYGLLVIVLFFPLLNQYALGGYVDGSGVGLAMMLTAFGALLFANRFTGRLFLLLATLGLVVLGVWEFTRIDQPYTIPREISLVFFVQTYVFIGAIAYFITESFYNKMQAYQTELEDEREKSVKLLLNILPVETANELKATGKATAKGYVSATVLFTDFVGFSKVSRQMTPNQLVHILDFYFKAFDNIIEKYGLEKIKTIGDAYMCVGGIPIVNDSHALDTVRAAIEMQAFVQKVIDEKQISNPFQLRIGIHTGALVAGVVGKNKFSYDIWGDTVNIAARMEQAGVPGKINISENTFMLVLNHFKCTPRGEIAVKNLGELKMYFVENDDEST